MINDDLFLTIENLVPKHRNPFTEVLNLCADEININLDESIPSYLYSLGKNAGVVGFDFSGEMISYVLYNKQPDHPILLTHWWVHPDFRRQGCGSRMISYISCMEKHSPIMTILNEYLWPAQELLKSLGFYCTQTIHGEDGACDQYKFCANAYSPMNRIATYYPSMF
jgi:GNAT superfamily N-acetyltransferase